MHVCVGLWVCILTMGRVMYGGKWVKMGQTFQFVFLFPVSAGVDGKGLLTTQG